jgi:hypothetical protein
LVVEVWFFQPRKDKHAPTVEWLALSVADIRRWKAAVDTVVTMQREADYLQVVITLRTSSELSPNRGESDERGDQGCSGHQREEVPEPELKWLRIGYWLYSVLSWALYNKTSGATVRNRHIPYAFFAGSPTLDDSEPCYPRRALTDRTTGRFADAALGDGKMIEQQVDCTRGGHVE